MEQLPNGYTLSLCAGAFPLSTDSMLLAHFVRLPRNAAVLDLGSGCGTLGLLLCAKDPGCTVTGVELDIRAHEEALDNARRNHLARLTCIHGDLRRISETFTPGSFDCCVSNPPYFSGGPASQATPLARREDCCTPGDLMGAAARCIKYGGDFFLVHKPERLAELIAKAAPHHLEAKRLQLIRHRENGPISLILLQFRKGGKPGLIWEEQYLFDSNGEPSPFYKQVYHLT